MTAVFSTLVFLAVLGLLALWSARSQSRRLPFGGLLLVLVVCLVILGLVLAS